MIFVAVFKQTLQRSKLKRIVDIRYHMANFCRKKPMRSHAFYYLFSGPKVNTHVFEEFSLCEIFSSLMLSFFMSFG